MGRGSSGLSGGSGAKEVIYGNTKFTITKGSNGYYLNVSSVSGNTPPTKHKIAYAKTPDKARVYLGPSLGYINFNSDSNLLNLLKNEIK